MLTGQKGWKEESTIEAPWNDVMQSVQNKYPNPHNNNVLNIDVLHRSVDHASGIMRSLRLFNSSWPMFSNLGQLKALEWSAIDGRKKQMVAVTHNIDLRGVLKAVERVEYSVHPKNDQWTLLQHSISIEAFPLIALTASSASRQAAIQGREALQWVLKHRLPLLHSYPNWNVNFTHTDTEKMSKPTIPDRPILVNQSFTSQYGEMNWKDRFWSSLRRRNTFPTVLAEQQRLNQETPSVEYAFFSDRQVSTPTVRSTSDIDDSPISRLGSQFESISRDMTAMRSALVRRSQRVARLFSRIDEYVVIM